MAYLCVLVRHYVAGHHSCHGEDPEEKVKPNREEKMQRTSLFAELKLLSFSDLTLLLLLGLPALATVEFLLGEGGVTIAFRR